MRNMYGIDPCHRNHGGALSVPKWRITIAPWAVVNRPFCATETPTGAAGICKISAISHRLAGATHIDSNLEDQADA